MAKPKVDQNACIACGNCAGVCPEVFDMSGDGGKSQVREMSDYSAHKAKIDQAISECPVKAISWED